MTDVVETEDGQEVELSDLDKELFNQQVDDVIANFLQFMELKGIAVVCALGKMDVNGEVDGEPGKLTIRTSMQTMDNGDGEQALPWPLATVAQLMSDEGMMTAVYTMMMGAQAESLAEKGESLDG